MTAVADTPSSLVERLADELAARWEAGDRVLVERLLDAHPAVAADPEAVLDLIAEELALRAEHGELTTADALAARFPHLARRVRALVECQQAVGPRPGPVGFPAVGETLGGFRLVAELGRGAAGRVYLAVQPDLADRAVVLKATAARGGEHLALARVQHTHVVPLHSAHDFPARGLRALCMPYFGGVPLSAVADAVPGRGWAAALDRARAAAVVPPPAAGPGVRFLAAATPADAVAWVGACLADALQHAHDRGLCHLDVKPSNVLLAADGTPMLLDFHLARPPLGAGDPPPAWLGGTPGFAPPEQIAAMQAVRNGRPLSVAVGPPADVFALGRTMSDALKAGPRPPVGLRDVLAKCVEPDPGARYPTAGDLAADLRRHLADQPLRGVANRSVAERWRKWRRRRPLALPLGLAFGALAAAGVGVAGYAVRQTGVARTAARDGAGHLAAKRFPAAAEAFRGGDAAVAGLPFAGDLRTTLREGRLAAERGRAAAELHRLAERVRPLVAADGLTPTQARAAAAACREVWAGRGRFDANDPGTRTDLIDLGILAACLGVRAAGPNDAEAAGRDALRLLDEAEAAFGPSGVLDLERSAVARRLGLLELADAAAGRAGSRPPRTAWEHLAVGRALLAAGDDRRAAGEFDRAVALAPGSLWANYHRGACALRLGDPADAAMAFSACLAAAPGSAWCWYNRGLALADLGRAARARADFDRALNLDPELTAARLARAGVLARGGDRDAALADLRAAEAGGALAADVAFHQAQVHLAFGERDDALRALAAGLAADPAHARCRDLQKRLRAGR